MINELTEEAKAVKGFGRSVVEHFSLVGLYGHKTIGLTSECAATIIIAQNGSGKTTLIGALNAFLRCEFSRLRELDLLQIKCKLAGIDEIVLNKYDIQRFFDIPADSEISLLARKMQIETTDLVDHLTTNPSAHNFFYYKYQDSIGEKLLEHFNYSRQDLNMVCERQRLSLLSRDPRVAKIIDQIHSTMSNYDIVYLPTYRRIELSLVVDTANKLIRNQRTRFKSPNNPLFSGDIQFGLADIQERLKDIHQSILYQSGYGYQQISASIINDMVDDKFDPESIEFKDIPAREELSIFFKRIKDNSGRVGPFVDVQIPNLDKIYMPENSQKETTLFLKYFLSKLYPLVRSMQDIENPVDEFIHYCNKYLSVEDQSTNLDKEHRNRKRRQIKSGKKLSLERNTFNINVIDIPTDYEMPLEALSSGEKQMVSLFSKLFLYGREKIVLIDEPEISLSIEWQKQILVDILNANLTKQVIAITHSPFIFDNCLDPFARSIEISYSD